MLGCGLSLHHLQDMWGLKQCLESTEQNEEKKQLEKDINLKDIKMNLANAKYVRSDVYTIVYIPLLRCC